MTKSNLKTTVKKYETALAAGDKNAAEAAYKDAIKKIDRAVARGIMHRNAAARKKSRFTIKLNNLGA